MNSTNKPWRSIVGLTCLVLAALVGVSWSRAQLHQRQQSSSEIMKGVFLLPPGQVIRQADLGYHTLAADLLFVRANLYYGHHLYTDEQLPWLANFIDVLLTVDPKFKKAYLWGAMATTYYKREIDFVPRDLVERANRILEKGMERFPDDFAFPMRIAFNLYYEQGDAKRSIPYFERASRLPGAPGWLKDKAADLYTKKGDRAMAREMVTSILAETEDDQLGESLHNRIDLLLDPEERARLIEQRQALIGAWRERYGYLPLDLYLLVRER